jgi:hypothetical protein
MIPGLFFATTAHPDKHLETSIQSRLGSLSTSPVTVRQGQTALLFLLIFLDIQMLFCFIKLSIFEFSMKCILL